MTDEARRQRILLVDDDPDMLAVLRHWLSPRFEVAELCTGETLVDEALSFIPDLIILDYDLPGADGFSLCERLRSVGRLKRVPVLFVTGCRSEGDFLEHLDVGGDAFLRKPVEREALIKHVDGLIS